MIKMAANKKKINWKVRFKNKVWLTSFLSLIIGFIFDMLYLFDVIPAFSQSLVMDVVAKVLTFLGLFGVIIDPTTEGLYDSERALSYDEPWDDSKAETEEHANEPEAEGPTE